MFQGSVRKFVITKGPRKILLKGDSLSEAALGRSGGGGPGDAPQGDFTRVEASSLHTLADTPVPRTTGMVLKRTTALRPD